MNETELLFTEVLGCSRTELYLRKQQLVSRENLTRISRALKRRLSGEPIEYIIGKTEFMGLEFSVNPGVLIPRPDTEVLVETCLNYLANYPALGFSDPEILEIGTGSGCVAVSLARSFSRARIVATDISQAALDVAETNARNNGVIERISFVNSDMFRSPLISGQSFDLIVSNPPYVKRNVIPTLAPEVRREPLIALDGGEDGLDIFRRIFREAPGHLNPRGLLLLETGYDQKEDLEEILADQQIFEVKEQIKDYNNKDRVMVLKLKE